MSKKLVLCDCLGSQHLDSDALSNMTGLACSKVYTNLCGMQIDAAAQEIAQGDAVLACQQERQRFEELAEEVDAEIPQFVDLRDRAGWGEGDATPKMAALAAEAAMSVQTGRSVDVISEGTCLIIGGDAAVKAATDLCDTLAVTVLLSSADQIPTDRRFDCVVGKIRRASGALGGFTVHFDGLQQLTLGGRGAFELGAPQSGAVSECDIILDLSGGLALFPAPEKREGYLRADPQHPPAVAQAVLAASQSIGTFEKPLYVRLEPSLCAHSRAEQPACSNCLNVCPTGAILSAGEHVAIDPMICAGCGSCSAVCPSGAISYDAPPVDTLFRRMSLLASTYRKAGGAQAQLLVHDGGFGAEMIALAARFGRGLPARVIPLEVDALSGFGHAEMLAALACGFEQVNILMSPKAEGEVIEAQAVLADALSGARAVLLLHPVDPDGLCDLLYAQGPAPVSCDPVLPIGARRQVARLAAKALQPDATLVALPENAPYGAVLVDTDACTLCLSCVSLCPSGALADNPDMPQLRFQEDACLQCGLCSNICPENAITLKPQMDLTDAAFTQRVLHEEEPFACIECGGLFGVKSTVERITEKLAGKHAMFANSEAAKMIQMCDNCRIQAQFHSSGNPFQGGARPQVRTSEDYFSKRKDH
ncbi:4Fe-4S binding protein [Sulfitobacter sp. M57]|uniref:4Fe-4S binding protein n=1 Tax=unclassified Sulfitobacter TaxID=196795 RepID=UPI0023E30256|nr:MULTISPECIES: 4Fe-4S binding protein [unclassified Sulfitobacter]MDF3416056.1 4Fe-4S binding protein [Sulfitobacter sp. KE5]MDF3423535.1 4Fe-4S binding protein [Sulfitobacter sp. KE43]MDF3434663.1 4Fe-4S binding protein [Sulfitobacter sp. KE42]MDF3460241.1 4Fe-4S binding protein [Sulfitobacter sp. S74]MDF3464201.1 4Fe-4S binding protein [Sulfitobacter sp. Ks18]